MSKLSLISGWLMFLWALALPLRGQVVTKNFQYKDGIYLTLEAWQRNQPDYSWDQLDSRLVTNPQTWVSRLAAVSVKATGQVLVPDSIKVLAVDGIPYLKWPHQQESRDHAIFIGLRVRGSLGYLKYEETVEGFDTFSAYNPLTGRAFRTGKVKRNKTLVHECLVPFESGELLPFTEEQLSRWVQKDEGLYASMLELPKGERKQQLFKILLIYNDRHPVHLLESRKQE